MCDILVNFSVALDNSLQVLETLLFGDDLRIQPQFHVHTGHITKLAPRILYLNPAQSETFRLQRRSSHHTVIVKCAMHLIN